MLIERGVQVERSFAKHGIGAGDRLWTCPHNKATPAGVAVRAMKKSPRCPRHDARSHSTRLAYCPHDSHTTNAVSRSRQRTDRSSPRESNLSCARPVCDSQADPDVEHFSYPRSALCFWLFVVQSSQVSAERHPPQATASNRLQQQTHKNGEGNAKRKRLVCSKCIPP